jgi:hypothetical protein
MIEILLLVKLFLLSWLITRFEPINMFLEMLPDNLVMNLIRLLLSCLKCVVFWTTLSMTGDVFIAAGMSFIGFWYDKLIGPIENKVRL